MYGSRALEHSGAAQLCLLDYRPGIEFALTPGGLFALRKRDLHKRVFPIVRKQTMGASFGIWFRLSSLAASEL
jgi:hypothetical protein